MSGRETERGSRALEAVSTLRILDSALDDEELGLNEAAGHVIALSRSLGNDAVITSHFYHHDIAPNTSAIGRIRHNMAAIGILLPLRYLSAETFRTAIAHPDYIPAAIDLMSRTLDGEHASCPMSTRDVVYSQKPRQQCVDGSVNCEKLDTVRFALGTDMALSQRRLYAGVYGYDYEAFRRIAIEELYARGAIDQLAQSMAHRALTATMAQMAPPEPRHRSEES